MIANFEDFDDPDQSYDNLVYTFRKLVDKHVPLKTKMLRGNSAAFVIRELRRVIYTRTRLKKRYNRNPKKENEIIFKKQGNKCVALSKRAIKQHFKKATEAGLIQNRVFRNLVKLFLSNKGGLAGSDISLVKNNRIVTEDRELVEIFNDHYINIVEKSSSVKPVKLQTRCQQMMTDK